jgi:N-methylhydantoinase B
MTREALATIPRGVYVAEDLVESDGLGNGPFRIKVRIEVARDRMRVDFTGTDPQARGPINCSFTGLLTGVRCVFKSVTNPELPANGGCFRMLDVVCPPGTFVSAIAPAPMSLYYESVLAAMDVVWKALAPAVPARLPAGHQRAVNATFIAGVHPDTGQLYVMGEPLVGGWGATAERDGDNGQFCCGNGETFNIPIELFESRYALKVEQYAFHDHEGGAGQFRGGKGVVLDYRVTGDEAYLTYATTRSSERPWALRGGQPGSVNGVEILRRDGSIERHAMCTRVRVSHGELIRITTGTGGGYGDPTLRRPEDVARDIKNGFITREQAVRLHGTEGSAA